MNHNTSYMLLDVHRRWECSMSFTSILQIVFNSMYNMLTTTHINTIDVLQSFWCMVHFHQILDNVSITNVMQFHNSRFWNPYNPYNHTLNQFQQESCHLKLLCNFSKDVGGLMRKHVMNTCVKFLFCFWYCVFFSSCIEQRDLEN